MLNFLHIASSDSIRFDQVNVVPSIQGLVVTCALHLEAPNALKCTGISVSITGFHIAHYATGGGKSRRVHRATDVFLSLPQVIPSVNGEFPVGKHQFSLQFLIPPNVPSTFKCPRGIQVGIFYTLCAEANGYVCYGEQHLLCCQYIYYIHVAPHI